MRLWYKVREGYSEGKTRVGNGKSRRSGRTTVERKRSNWWQWDSASDDDEDADSNNDNKNTDETPEAASFEMQEIITELDVLYGEQQPFFGFQRVKNGPVLPKDPGGNGKVKESVDLVFRRGNPRTLLSFPSPCHSCLLMTIPWTDVYLPKCSRKWRSPGPSASTPLPPQRDVQNPPNRRPALLGLQRRLPRYPKEPLRGGCGYRETHCRGVGW